MKHQRRPAHDGVTPLDVVPCAFCDEPIAAITFTFMSSTRRVLQALCPSCGHPMFRTAGTWLRIGGSLEDVRSA